MSQTKINRIGIFVDVQNIYYTCRQAHQRQFDYRKFWKQISQRGEIQLAYAYAVQRHDDQQIKFQDALRHIGFEIKLKPFIQRADGSAKGDWDVGITVDMIDCAEQLDELILLSGDGDFAVLLAHLQNRHHKNTVVYGVPQLTAKALSDQTNEFVAIDSNLLK